MTQIQRVIDDSSLLNRADKLVRAKQPSFPQKQRTPD
jgi:hypothetical protein